MCCPRLYSDCVLVNVREDSAKPGGLRSQAIVPIIRNISFELDDCPDRYDLLDAVGFFIDLFISHLFADR